MGGVNLAAKKENEKECTVVQSRVKQLGRMEKVNNIRRPALRTSLSNPYLRQ